MHRKRDPLESQSTQKCMFRCETILVATTVNLCTKHFALIKQSKSLWIGSKEWIGERPNDAACSRCTSVFALWQNRQLQLSRHYSGSLTFTGRRK